MFNGFPKESVILHKLNGEVISDIKAIVEPKQFFIEDSSLNIEEGDFFERILPNDSHEYYRVEERGFYTGMGGVKSHYQTVVSKTNKSEMDKQLMPVSEPSDTSSQSKVFISHSSKDKEYVEALTELLEDIGLPEGSIVCTSVPGYGVPGEAKIYDWLREQFTTCELRVIFVLSNNYYNSPASLNEMGAAWVTKATDTLMLLPGFDFGDIKGCIDSTKIGIKLDGDEEELKHRLNELKDVLLKEHSLPQIAATRWERKRDAFIKNMKAIGSRHQSSTSVKHDSQYEPFDTSNAKMPDHVPVEAAFLVVYAAASNGQIIKTDNMSTGTSITAGDWEFTANQTHREIARWKGAVDSLAAWHWIKNVDRKGNVFELTDLGYREADILKEGMEIDTEREPINQLKEFEN